MPTEEIVFFENHVAQLWWRIPLTLAVLFIFFFAVSKATGEEGNKKEKPVYRTPHYVWPLRYLFILVAFRFAWVCFASLGEHAAHPLHWAEAFAWYFYLFLGLPLWLSSEIEAREDKNKPRF